jgi:hypothetical protein
MYIVGTDPFIQDLHEHLRESELVQGRLMSFVGQPWKEEILAIQKPDRLPI